MTYRFTSLLRRLLNQPRIPRRIHQIWNDNSPPSELKPFIQSWKQQHPDWNYCLWSLKDIDRWLAFHPAWRRLLDQAPRMVQKADILRAAILQAYGGIYADLDVGCLKPLNDLLHYDFVAGREDKPYVSICNAVIISAPNHPIWQTFQRLLAGLTANRTDCVFESTGPLPFTFSCIVAKTSRTWLAPKDTFYPFSWAEKEKCLDSFPRAYTKHYWNSGWFEEGRYVVDAYWLRKPPTAKYSGYS